MKYKLIKEYPGSPNLGYIVDLNKTGHNSQGEYVQSMYDTNPEFWKLVVKKDYEILSVITNNNKFIEKVYNQDATIEPYWKIHSVKRLSDGEIFTIGDIVKCEDCKGKITSLEIYDNDIYLNGIDNKMPFGYTLCNTLDCFEIPQKAKQSLFTTEDGVDIFKGDKYWKVNNYLNLSNRQKATGSTSDLNPAKYFSTKEKAEEYILMNKPVLSLKDIEKLLCKNTSSYFLEKFKKLVNQKYNSPCKL